MTKREINLTKIMADTLEMPVFHTIHKTRRYYDEKGEVVPESWLPDDDCIIIRHRTSASLDKWLNQVREKKQWF